MKNTQTTLYMQTNTSWEDTNDQNLRNAITHDQCDCCKRTFTQHEIDEEDYIKIRRKAPIMFHRGSDKLQRVYLMITVFRCNEC